MAWLGLRLRVRTLMALVALVAVACAVSLEIARTRELYDRTIMRGHASYYRSQAEAHRDKERALRSDLDRLRAELEVVAERVSEAERWLDPDHPPPRGEYEALKSEIASIVRRAKYHAAMTSKYERAAAEPWSPVGSDPPEPN
jgi:hypothetical protein